MDIQKCSKVQVNFISESRTEFSGTIFKGIGIVDLIEDGRVFGKLLNGTPFMCGISDVSPHVENLSPDEASFQECYLTAGGKQIELEKEDGAYTHSKSQMAWEIWQVKAVAPALTDQMICAIESTVENQLKASGINSDPFRIDGEKIWNSAIEAQESSND